MARILRSHAPIYVIVSRRSKFPRPWKIFPPHRGTISRNQIDDRPCLSFSLKTPQLPLVSRIFRLRSFFLSPLFLYFRLFFTVENRDSLKRETDNVEYPRQKVKLNRLSFRLVSNCKIRADSKESLVNAYGELDPIARRCSHSRSIGNETRFIPVIIR